MADYLALDWDDQRLVGVAAQVASKHVQIRAVLDFKWAEGETPSEQPEAAGKRLRAELDQISASNGPVIVSLPREEAIVRLLELPECSDDELPELVRFQAVTRSAMPLERLLLDYLPLPTLKETPGRRVWMATIGKGVSERIQTMLSAAGLEATAITLSSLGAAELIAHQASSGSAATDAATLIVSCIDLRIEITAIWQNRVVLMHSATLSSHDPPEDQLSQILAETARSTVALSQAAPGLQIGLGWLIGSRSAQSPLANTLSERFGFKFHVLTDPTSTPGVSAEGSSPLASTPLAWAPLGLLLEQSSQRVDSVDFLHPRRQHPKPDRRKLYIGLSVGAVVLLLVGIWFAIQSRVWQLEKQIASLKSENDAAQLLLDKNAPLRETAASIDDWAQRDIDWLEQFRTIEQAKGGADKLYLTSFDANVAGRSALAVIVATGRAKLPNEVDDFEDQLHQLGYRVTPKEISEDTTDPQYPVKIDLNLEIVPKAEGAAEPKGGPGIVRPGGPKPAASSGVPSAPASAAPSSAASTPVTTPATTAVPGPAASEKSAAAPTGQASAEAPTVQPANQPAAAQPTASPMPAPNGEAGTQSPMPAESGTQPMPQPSAPGKN
ncbi:MAG TPA: hypothetical protein VGP63_00460 [Planctomycetaceae bacterium]|nr:hypothetical protein [Planctomycetaceae bacterium]